MNDINSIISLHFSEKISEKPEWTRIRCLLALVKLTLVYSLTLQGSLLSPTEVVGSPYNIMFIFEELTPTHRSYIIVERLKRYPEENAKKLFYSVIKQLNINSEMVNIYENSSIS